MTTMTEPGRLLAAARQEIRRLRATAWDCAKFAGADMSGAAGPDDLSFDPRRAVEAVCELRRRYDSDAATTACHLIERIPENPSTGSSLERAKTIAEAGLQADTETLERFDVALPEGEK